MHGEYPRTEIGALVSNNNTGANSERHMPPVPVKV